jgi:hypothetical protein
MIEALAQNLGLGSLLETLRSDFGGYDLLDHWQRGEFHHDLVVRVEGKHTLPGPVLVVATNCNGGVKEILCFASPPAHDALWHFRCPQNPEFSGELPPLLASAKTVHWIDACELLRPDARSEYRPEHRERQPGGGWQPKGCGVRSGSGSYRIA